MSGVVEADGRKSAATRPNKVSATPDILMVSRIAFGEYDGVAICGFPDNTAAAACSMSAAATGAFSRFETTTLLTAKEAEAAMNKANTTKTKSRRHTPDATG